MLKYFCVFAIVIAVAVSGCAKYTVSEPNDGPRARLRGVLEGDMRGKIMYVDQNVCGDRPDLSGVRFLSSLEEPYLKRSLGMPHGKSDLSAREWGEMYVRADQQVSVGGYIRYSDRSCHVKVYFKPEKGRDYEFEFVVGAGSCKLSAHDITDGDIKPVPASGKEFPCN